jgi:hypothetical protein
MDSLISRLLNASDSVRYAAIYHNGQLHTRSREGTAGASSSESDKYEELLVNPAILKLATQRGEIDCGGCRFVLIRYGNFFQLVRPWGTGHVSICIALEADPLALAPTLFALLPEAS